MTAVTTPTPADIRQARADNPKMRERDLAARLGVSEAALVAAACGFEATRIELRIGDILTGLQGVGEVMALTRNESAVHEKIGVYQNVTIGEKNGLVLGDEIDLRIFPGAWAHGFVVRKEVDGDVRRSLQFFDAAGDAVHKVHLRPASDVAAFEKLVAPLTSEDQAQAFLARPLAASQPTDISAVPAELAKRWSAMTDVHQLHGLLQSLNLTRRQAIGMIGHDFAWRLEEGALATMLDGAVQTAIPIMCFVGSKGCIQIHSGPIRNVKPMGPWINVMDETFHLHLRLDHVADAWTVRKPTKDGHVTSIEAYDEAGRMIIQFFGKRHEGQGERDDWRALAEDLPRLAISTAA